MVKSAWVVEKLTFIALLIIFTSIHSASADQTQSFPELSANKITYYTENYPPSNYFNESELVGVSVETLKLMWERMGVESQDIYMVPWARGYRNTLIIPNTMLFTMSRTPEREYLFKWVGPIFKAKHVLLAKANFEPVFTSIESAFPYTVATVRDDISEVSLINQKFPEDKLIKVTKLSQALLMLNSDRADLMLLTNDALPNLLKELNLESTHFKQVWQVNEIGNYFAFSKTVPDSLIMQFQQAFDAIATERETLREKYGLTDQ